MQEILRSLARAMTNLKGRLTASTAACLLIGIGALIGAWRQPDNDVLTILATAAGWPWALAMLEGGLVWWRGKAMQASGLEHALFVYATGGAAAALLGALALGAANVELPAGAHLPCGPLNPLCDAVTYMAIACVACGLTLGFVFPALLPPAAAWTSSRLLGEKPPSMPWLRTAIALVTLCWLGALLTGLALAFA